MYLKRTHQFNLNGVYTPQEVADILYVSKMTILTLCKEDKIKNKKMGHRTIRIYGKDLQNYISTSAPDGDTHSSPTLEPNGAQEG